MLLRSWHIELVVVATLLSAFNLLVDRPLLEWVGTIWALGSFFEWQLKHQKEPVSPEAENQLRRDYLRKEGLWVAYFTLLGEGNPTPTELLEIALHTLSESSSPRTLEMLSFLSEGKSLALVATGAQLLTRMIESQSASSKSDASLVPRISFASRFGPFAHKGWAGKTLRELLGG